MGPDQRTLRVLNVTKGTVLVEHGRVADTLWRRVVGLLRDSSLAPGDGLWIVPCNSIHSVGMKFRFDAVFLDANYRVVYLVRNMAPWRATRIVGSARSVLELPTGGVERSGTEIGDEVSTQIE